VLGGIVGVQGVRHVDADHEAVVNEHVCHGKVIVSIMVIWNSTGNMKHDRARPGVCNKPLSGQSYPNHLEE